MNSLDEIAAEVACDDIDIVIEPFEVIEITKWEKSKKWLRDLTFGFSESISAFVLLLQRLCGITILLTLNIGYG
jgi:hypothetical protein